MSDLSDDHYRRLLAFRTGLRRFLKWSADRAAQAGVTAPQHQLLLAVRGHPGDRPPSIGDLAFHLVERQHSVSELVDRAVRAGLVRRLPDPDDRRVVRVALTARGQRILARLAALHAQELRRLQALLREVPDGLEPPPEP